MSRVTAAFARSRYRFQALGEFDLDRRRIDAPAADTTRPRLRRPRVRVAFFRVEAMKSDVRAAASDASVRSMRMSLTHALRARALFRGRSGPSHSPSVSGAASSRRRRRAPARHVTRSA
ncbi:hypothetical protein C7S16_6519 [Burkholderia thailandensis]|uniref:Uncharacterized protein n=1 Tax=Burkholderia thailandensis TaxID=57975 RepID=A0AAW9CPK8_BURTH|nr:hypothetical protein [Burkholderia thailandensis]